MFRGRIYNKAERTFSALHLATVYAKSLELTIRKANAVMDEVADAMSFVIEDANGKVVWTRTTEGK